jgi:polar amino acid transport system substrate-binding protein/glutamate/aspartate transport system substrate-binding protein
MPACADALDTIKKDATIRLAVRADAPPFSAKGEDGKFVGYSVSLCQAVVEQVKEQLQLADLKISYVPVTAENRFSTLHDGGADLLCEATTATLARRDIVDFSIPTFVSGAGLAIKSDGPKDIPALKDKKIGVLGGTTTEEALRTTLKDKKVTADVILAKTHEEGLAALEKGDVAAYFADRTILMYLLKAHKSPQKLLLSDAYLTVEPYALALPYGDDKLRLAVDRALSHLYRSGQVAKIFKDTFGPNAKPTGLQRALYTISGLPE